MSKAVTEQSLLNLSNFDSKSQWSSQRSASSLVLAIKSISGHTLKLVFRDIYSDNAERVMLSMMLNIRRNSATRYSMGYLKAMTPKDGSSYGYPLPKTSE